MIRPAHKQWGEILGGKYMRRSLFVAALSAVMVVAMGATAFAGEVNGKGEPTPIQTFQAGSICAFSGQNDDPDSTEMFDGGRVQSFGDIVQEAVKLQKATGDAFGPGKLGQVVSPIVSTDGPGVHCRGFASQD
jgi:hypothetical protein